ncbi:hypothetical protein BTS2_3680 [Bacillus sp. TS-2]|nr:hypothetical protein BTS2_3680 [Bacillus sp. TS-2]
MVQIKMVSKKEGKNNYQKNHLVSPQDICQLYNISIEKVLMKINNDSGFPPVYKYLDKNTPLFLKGEIKHYIGENKLTISFLSK